MGVLDSALTAAETALQTFGHLADAAVSAYDPERGAMRRAVRARYDGARTTKHRRPSRDNSTGDVHARRDAATLRAQARNLERNHDLVRGAINVQVRNVVGPRGISVEPTPRRADGSIHDEFARNLLKRFREWSKRPEVTWTMDWVEAQQMVCRSWLRDGEQFSQHVVGGGARAPHGTAVPYSLELLEADHCPLNHTPINTRINSGIEQNAWGRPVAYHLHKVHPGDDKPRPLEDLKRVPANRIIHLALRDRLSSLRGVSVLAPCITRFDDIKDYEEAERVAARISARIAAYIKRDSGMQWGPAEDEEHEQKDPDLYPGAFITNMAPGEEIDTVNPNRPNTQLGEFREGQLRAAAAGMDISFSALARDYNGTYSAQRQELVETWTAYEMLTARFVAHFVAPVWEQFVATVVAAGLVDVPDDVDLETLHVAEFRGPAMPWIDPLKEAQGIRLTTRTGLKSLTQCISERGRRIQDVFDEIQRERELAGEMGIALEADPATRAIAAGAANDPAGETGNGAGADNETDEDQGNNARQRAPRKRAAKARPAAKRKRKQPEEEAA